MGEAATAVGGSLELLIFELAGQLYALPSSVVKEVLRSFSVVPVPNAPPIVLGLINVRGEIMPLLSLRTRLGVEEKPLSLTDHFIIAKDEHRQVALRVDRVLNLQRVPFSRPFDPGRFASGSEVISGIATIPEGMVLIHDLGRFLSDSQRAQIDSAIRELASASSKDETST